MAVGPIPSARGVQVPGDAADCPRQHILKLSAGCDSLATLQGWQADRQRLHGYLFHRTRMMPQRKDALLAGGSIYWVIRGQITVRQALLDLRPVLDEDGRKATHFILDPRLVRTLPRAQRAFQGWRYLDPADAPPDLDAAEASDGDGPPRRGVLPAELQAELRALGLL